MLLKKLTLFILLIICSCSAVVYAQMNTLQHSTIYSTDENNTVADTTALFNIREVVIEGNRKTKDYIILRELSFKQDQQYPLNELIDRFHRTREQLMNTTLFLSVVVSLKSLQGYEAYISVTVKERWYIFPLPFVKVVDNNLQQWVMQQDMDMDRVKYGIKMKHSNITGRNDKLYMNLTHGYTREVSLRYADIAIDKQLHWFGSIDVSYGQNRDINYTTLSHQRLNYKNPERFVNTFLRGFAEVSYRPAIKTKHSFGIGFTHEQILDTLWKINPSFSFQNSSVRYPEAFYRLQYFDVDFIRYPTDGIAADILLQKKGMSQDVNLWQLTARTSATWPVSEKYFFNLNTTGVLKLPFRQPYNMQQFVGSGNMYLQGYEDFVIDGVAGGFTKATFTRKLLNRSFHIPSKRIKRLNTIPVKMYAKVFGNTGYIYNEEPHFTNTLNNRLLYSGGLGLDIVLFYDLTFKFEWSWNHLGQNGIYLHDRRYL
jgi:outer membrane protein assembly factor BamA